MMKLKVKGNYVNEPLGVAFKAGMVIEVDDKLAAHLLADAPENFTVHTEPVEEPKRTTKRVPAKGDKK